MLCLFVVVVGFMAEMAGILRGLATSNEGDAHGLLFAASPRGLILNIFRIYDR